MHATSAQVGLSRGHRAQVPSTKLLTYICLREELVWFDLPTYLLEWNGKRRSGDSGIFGLGETGVVYFTWCQEWFYSSDGWGGDIGIFCSS